MTCIRRFAVTSLLAGTLPVMVLAQTPPQAPRAGARVQSDPNAAEAATRERYLRRSIVHHYPHPYPEYYHGDQTAGFRNPGGVGRYLEYYPPNNQFQERGDPVRVARFDQGGGAPDRAEQLQAQQIGIQRQNSIMNHIDNYARPSFGVGYFGGFY